MNLLENSVPIRDIMLTINVCFLPDETDMLIKEGSDIKVEGAPSAFDQEFKDMEDMLEDVRKILSGTNVTAQDLDELRDKLQQIR